MTHSQPSPWPPEIPRPWRSTSTATELMIGALIPPVLLSLLATRALADGWTQIGLVSEQVFRGERLPTLNMPPPSGD